MKNISPYEMLPTILVGCFVFVFLPSLCCVSWAWLLMELRSSIGLLLISCDRVWLGHRGHSVLCESPWGWFYTGLGKSEWFYCLESSHLCQKKLLFTEVCVILNMSHAASSVLFNSFTVQYWHFHWVFELTPVEVNGMIHISQHSFLRLFKLRQPLCLSYTQVMFSRSSQLP